MCFFCCVYITFIAHEHECTYIVCIYIDTRHVVESNQMHSLLYFYRFIKQILSSFVKSYFYSVKDHWKSLYRYTHAGNVRCYYFSILRTELLALKNRFKYKIHNLFSNSPLRESRLAEWDKFDVVFYLLLCCTCHCYVYYTRIDLPRRAMNR